MDGNIKVTYRVLCEGDLNKEVTLEQLLLNEKIVKAIKSEFAKGLRNVVLSSKDEGSKLVLETQKELQHFEVSKDDFADILPLAEEDATVKKLFKKDCDRVELVDIDTSSV